MNPSETPIIPDHELIRLVGRGSYGEVWYARNALGTARAVKIVRRDRFDSDRPYLREFSGIQKFEPISRSYDGLVDILQVGRNDDAGFFYYVMELADDAYTTVPAYSIVGLETTEPGSNHGTAPRTTSSALTYQPRTLASEIKTRGRIPPVDALPLFNNLAIAVGHIHSHGLLHRDIKPSNVIFVAGVPKLADIGLVSEPGESETFVGTPGFIPPEGPGTISADLYALGKLMYEAVTGRDRQEFPALALDPSNPAGNAELLEINEVLLRCCDPVPTQRYQNAAELQADLAVLRSGHSVQRLRAYERSFRVARKIGVITTIAAALAIAASLFSRRQEGIARENFQNSERLRTRAEEAERSAKQRLYNSLVAQARAERRSAIAGARETALNAIRQAAHLQTPNAELRSEAIATLALVDVVEKMRWKPASSAPLPFCMNQSGELLARTTANGAIEIERVADHIITHTIQLDGISPEWLGPFSSDGRWLAFTTTNRICLVDVEAERERPWPIQPDQWKYLRFKRQTSLSAFPLSGGQTILDLDTGDAQHWLLPSTYTYNSISPNLTHVALTENRGETVHIWNLASGRDTTTIHLSKKGGAITVEWNNEGTRIALGTADHRVKIWGLAETNAVELADFAGHGAEVTALMWSPDGRLVASSGWDETTRFWNVISDRAATMAIGSGMAFQFSDDSHLFARMEAWGKDMILSEVNLGGICRLIPEPGLPSDKSPNAVMFTPDSQWLVTGSNDGLRSFRVRDGQPVAFRPDVPVTDIIPFPAPAREFAFLSYRGRFLGSWMAPDESTFEFQAPRETARSEFPRHHPTGNPWVGNLFTNLMVFTAGGTTYPLPSSSSVVTTRISPNGRWVAATFADHRAAFWNLGEDPHYNNLGPARGYALAFDPGSRHVYHATNFELCKTETSTGKRDWSVKLSEEAHPNGGIEISPDGTLIAAAMSPIQVTLVDPKDGQILAVLEHPDRQLINGLAFSPDGNYLAVICTTHITQLWDLRAMRAELGKMNLDW